MPIFNDFNIDFHQLSAGQSGKNFSFTTKFSINRLLLLSSALLVLWLQWPQPLSANTPQASPQTATQAKRTQDSSKDLEPNQVDVQKSRVYIFVDKTGLGHQHAIEGRLASGSLDLGAAEEAGEFVFDMRSFDADTDAARRYLGLSGSTDSSTRKQVNDNMKNKSILNVSQFPTAKFAIKSAKALNRKGRKGNPLYEFVGEFTLRGRTLPLKFEAEVESQETMAHVKGQFNILQTQYGMTPFRKALGAVGVADQLTIHGDLWVAVEPQVNAAKQD